MKATDLIHGGYYILGEEEIVKFYALNGHFYTLDDRCMGISIADADTGELDFLVHGESCMKIAPMPLTEEILEKNGFQRGTIVPSKFYRNIDNEQIMLCLYDFCYELEYVHWNESNDADITHHLDVQQPMRFVHELQHALRLCGLHDLADDFKV